MRGYKTFRYRVYPTATQEKRLLEWETSLRFLWNLALEQWKIWGDRPKGERRCPDIHSQRREFTEVRKAVPWLADVPRNVADNLLIELDKAWQVFFRGQARKPRWKRKVHQARGMTETNWKTWRFVGEDISFPKIGRLRTVLSRPIEGKAKTCTLIRDVDQWFAHVVCDVEIPETTPRIGPVIALDFGITHLIADSNGAFVDNPRHYERSRSKIVRAQRTMSRRTKGSKNREKARVKLAKAHRKVRRQREYFIHCLSSTIAKSNGTVVIEDLDIPALSRGRLSGMVNNTGWGAIAQQLSYKLARSGGFLVKINASNSSITCSRCDHIDEKSRYKRRFCCTACGLDEHADTNAAKVLLKRHETPGNPWRLPVEGMVPEATLRSRKVRPGLRLPRRSLA